MRRIFLFLVLGCFALAASSQPLIEAIKANNVKLAKQLIKKGAEINQTDSNGATPLMWAVLKSDLNFCKFLVAKGADPRKKGVIYLDSTKTQYYGNYLGICAMNARYDILEWLIKEVKINPDDREFNLQEGKENGWTALQFAVYKGDFQCVNLLLGLGANPNYTTADSLNMLMESISYGHDAFSRQLLEVKGLNYFTSNTIGFDALHYAVFINNPGLVRFLIQKGFNVNKQSDSLITPLHIAIGKNFLKVSRVLMESGADTSLTNKWGETPGYLARYNGYMGQQNILKNDFSACMGSPYDSLFAKYEDYYNRDIADSIAYFSERLFNQAQLEYYETSTQYTEALNYAGIGYYNINQYDKALFYFKKSLAQVKKYNANDTANRCLYLRNIINTHWALSNHYDSLAPYYKELLPLTARFYGDTSSGYLELYRKEIQYRKYYGNAEAAVRDYLKLYSFIETHNKTNTSTYFELVNSLMVYYGERNEDTKAMEMFQKIWAPYLQGKLPPGFDVKNAVKNISILLESQGKYEAVQPYLSAYRRLIIETKPIKFEEVFQYSYLKGIQWFNMEKYDSTLLAFENGRRFGKLSTKTDENLFAYMYLKSADALIHLERFLEAERFLDTAIVLFANVKQPDAGFFNDIHNLQITTYNFTEFPIALKLNNILMRMASSTNDTAYIINANKVRMYILFKMNQIAEAGKQLDLVLKLESVYYKKTPVSRVGFLLESAAFFTQLNDTVNAIKQYQNLHSFANALPNRDSVQLLANYKIYGFKAHGKTYQEALKWFATVAENAKIRGSYNTLEKKILDDYVQLLGYNGQTQLAFDYARFWANTLKASNYSESVLWQIKSGDVYYWIKDYKTAQTYYKATEAALLKKYDVDAPEMVLIHVKLAVNYYGDRQYDQAIPYFKKIIQTEERQGASKDDLKTYYRSLKVMYFAINDLQSAYFYSNKLIEINKSDIKSDFKSYRESRVDHINICVQLNRYDEAEALGNDLFSNMSKYSQFQPIDKLKIFKILSYLYSDMGNFSKSTQYLDSASDILTTHFKNDLKLQSDVVITRSLLLNVNGKSKEGLNELAKFYKQINGKTSDTSEYLNQILTYLGLAYFYRFEIDSAVKVLQLVQHHYADKNLSNEICIQAYQYNSAIYSRLKQHDSALKYMVTAERMARNLGKVESIYKMSIQVGTIYADLKMYDSALAIFNGILENPRQVGVAGTEILEEAAIEKAYVLNAVGNFDEAYTICSDYLVKRRNKVLDEILFLSAVERETYISSKSSGLRLINRKLIQYVDKAPQFGSLILDNEIFIKGLALETNTRLLQMANNSNDPALTTLLDQLKTGRNKLEQLYNKGNTGSNEIHDLEGKIAAWEKSLNKKLGVNFKEDYQRNFTEVIKSKLGENEVLVDFFSRDKHTDADVDTVHYYAIILAKNYKYPKVFKVTNNKVLDQLFRNTGAQTGAAQLAMIYDSRGSKLVNKNLSDFKNCYSVLWQKIDSVIAGKKDVYITPSGYLSKVAFAAIKDTSNTYISDKYNIHILSSSRQILKPSVAEAAGKKTGLVFGGIDYEMDSNTVSKTATLASRSYVFDSDSTRTGFSFLNGTVTETKQIVNYLSGKKYAINYLTGARATEENIKALQTTKPYFIHIATHGFYLPEKMVNYNTAQTDVKQADNPLLRSGLILAGGNKAWLGKPIPSGSEDGILNSFEISNLDFRSTRFVVLSACETGLGDIKGSEGVFGLQRAFKLAGVEYIVNSLWQVPDAQTAELMAQLYLNWSKGMPFETAFFMAQKALKAKYEPYYWAAFQLVK